MKRMLWLIAVPLALAVGAALLAGCAGAPEMIEKAEGGPHTVAPTRATAAPEEPVDGGVTDNSDPDAPKTINSTQIISFDCRFSTLDAAEPGALGNHVYELRAKLENGAVKGAYRVLDTGEERLFRESHEFLAELQGLAEAYGLSRFNGLSYAVAGLPEDYGAWVEVVYASGERISAANNQDNYLPWGAMNALVALFERGAAVPPVPEDFTIQDAAAELSGLHDGLFVTRADSAAVSFYARDGGSFLTRNRDGSTGKELGFSDVFRDLDYLPSLLLKEFQKAYPEREFVENAIDLIRESVERDDGNVSFALGCGFVHIFAEEAYLSEQPGELHATLSCVQNPGQVRAFYEVAPARWLLPLDYGVTYWRPDTAGGFRMTAAVSGEETVWTVSVVDGKTYEERFYGAPPDCWLAHTDGNDFIYLRVPSGDVSMRTKVYAISETGVSRRTNDPLGLAIRSDSPPDPNRMRMNVDSLVYDANLYLLPCGTYRVTSNGRPELVDEYYSLDGPWVLLREGGRYHPADPAAAAVSGGMWTLVAGERLRPLRTDLESWIDFSTEDGREVRFSIDRFGDGMRLDNFGTLNDVFAPEGTG